MTATTNELGQLVLPAEACAEAHAEPGTRFDVLVSSSGEIWLRRQREPKQTLLEHMAALRGLEIEPRRDPIPKRVRL